jgi:hypothetical protein
VEGGEEEGGGSASASARASGTRCGFGVGQHDIAVC